MADPFDLISRLSDSFHYPDQGAGDVQIIRANSLISNVVWTPWRRPPGCRMSFFFMVGSGGSGAGGFSRTAGSAGGGGGGGGGSGNLRILIPTFFLPDELFFSVGKGAAGGAANSIGVSGVSTLMAVQPNSTSGVLIGTTNGGGTTGFAGTGSAGGNGGGGGAAVGQAGILGVLNLGMWFSSVGDAGTAGGAQTGAVGVTQAGNTQAAMTFGGGTGGGGSTTADFGGGQFTAIVASLFPTILGVAQANGISGFPIPGQGFNLLAGQGGGSNNSGVGGAGGAGSFGCGGGGGGAGTTGGQGGTAGDGIVIAVSW
jgi:hypothetical protein